MSREMNTIEQRLNLPPSPPQGLPAGLSMVMAVLPATMDRDCPPEALTLRVAGSWPASRATGTTTLGGEDGVRQALRLRPCAVAKPTLLDGTAGL